MILLLMISSISPGAVVSQVRVYSFMYIYYIYTNLFDRVYSVMGLQIFFKIGGPK